MRTKFLFHSKSHGKVEQLQRAKSQKGFYVKNKRQTYTPNDRLCIAESILSNLDFDKAVVALSDTGSKVELSEGYYDMIDRIHEDYGDNAIIHWSESPKDISWFKKNWTNA